MRVRIYSFFWQNSIPLYKYTVVLFIRTSVDRHVVVSTFWLLQVILLWTFMTFVWMYVFSSVGSTVAGLHGNSMFNFRRNWQTVLTKWLHCFKVSPKMSEDSNFFTSSPVIATVRRFRFRLLMGVKCSSAVILVYISLVTHAVEIFSCPYWPFVCLLGEVSV